MQKARVPQKHQEKFDTFFNQRLAPEKCKKFLKKYLANLTLPVSYPKNAFRLAVLSNISPQILAIFGNFVHRYGDKNLHLRW